MIDDSIIHSHALRLANGTRMKCRQPKPDPALISYLNNRSIIPIGHRTNPGPKSHYDSTFLIETKNSTTELCFPSPSTSEEPRRRETEELGGSIPNEDGKGIRRRRQGRQSAWRLITADLDGGVDSEQVGLGEEHPLALDAELPDLRL